MRSFQSAVSQGAEVSRMAAEEEVFAGKVVRFVVVNASRSLCDRCSSVWEVDVWICECKQGVSCQNFEKTNPPPVPASSTCVDTEPCTDFKP